jgi:hypothetical protein
MKIIILTFILTTSYVSFSQNKDSLKTVLGQEVGVVDKIFLNQYRYYKPIVLKVYPYALFAADLLDKMNNDLESIEKRRKRNKFLKKSYKTLKADFKYVLLDMYISEGQVLMKLIARETGMTVYEIIKKYKGYKDAAMFNLMGKLYDQNIKENYNPKKEYVLEAILRDIKSGKIQFNDKVETFHKEEYKKKKKETKEYTKRNKKRNRQRKKDNRKKNKEPKYFKPE